MVACLYNDIEISECSWVGEESQLVDHLVSVHEVYQHSGATDQIVLELNLDTDYSGYRYVILEFLKNDQKNVAIFEEVFDDVFNIFKLSVRTIHPQGMIYKILLQGESSSMWYCGNLLGLEKVQFQKHHQCLQVHKAQLTKFCSSFQDELRYKLIISLL